MNDTKKIVKTTPVFQKNLAAYQSGWKIICNEGSSRSSKSYSIIQLLIAIALKDKGKKISIVSHSLPHIKRGAFRDFKQILERLEIWDDDNWMATNFIYTFSNGSYIELFGLEDEGKARGPGRDILFINEANLINLMLFRQLAQRTTDVIFLDYNPADFTSWVYDVADNPKNKKIHSTYLDNRFNLSPSQIEFIEDYKNLPDDFMWKVYGLGLRGASAELIYTNWKYCDSLPDGGEVIYGLDFGYNNPTALVKVVHKDKEIFAEQIIYQTKLTTFDLIEKLKQLGISREEIYCDAAEPKTIEEIYRAGFNVKPANKDVYAGILTVKSLPLYLTNKSHNFVEEIRSYKWKKDKEDKPIDEPVKANDHLMDALRYAVHTKLSKYKFKVIV